jgi:hypothetical protein
MTSQLHTRSKLVGGLVDRGTEPEQERSKIGRGALSPWYVWVNCGDGCRSIKQPRCNVSTNQERRELNQGHREKLSQQIAQALMGWPEESKEDSPPGHSVVFSLRLITRVAFGREHCSHKLRSL